MNFDMPKAVFCGLALIAAAIFFGPGSTPATAEGGIQKIAICDPGSGACAQILRDQYSLGLYVTANVDAEVREPR